MSFLGGNGRLYAEDDDNESGEKLSLVSRLYADPEEDDEPDRPVTPKRVARVEVDAEPRILATRGTVSTVLELLGIGAISAGGFLVAPWLGCMLLGALLVLLGVAVGYGE